MRARSAERVGAVLLAASAVAAGCVLVTDLGTGGYQLAGPDGCSPSPDASCSATPTFCGATENCPAGEICCLTMTLGMSGGAACQMGPCSSPGAQLCGGDADCEAGDCIPQTCLTSSGLQVIHTCGTGVGLIFCDAGP